MAKALIIVDMQFDFVDPEGALYVKGGQKIIDDIVKEAYSGYDLVVATRDFHPQTHISFKEVGGDWPMHCIAGTKGAQLLPEIDMVADYIVSKGTDPDKEAYSGFEGTVLTEMLEAAEIEEVSVVGVATDYCVLNTAMDAKFKAGIDNVTVLLDCVVGVAEETTEDALLTMNAAGIKLTQRG